MSSPAGPVPCWVQATMDKILSAGSSENQTQDDQTLSSDGTPAMRAGPVPRAKVLSCWAVSFGRAGYYGQTVDHSCTFQPVGGDGSAR